MYSGAQVVLEPLEANKARQKSQFAVENELRIALVGKTGVGKSSTANTLAGGKYFDAGLGATGLTQICQQKKVHVKGKDILVIDTPGIFDSESNHEAVEQEIKRCVHIGAPGLHAIIFVMEVGRFRQDDNRAIETFLNFFENEMKDRVIVLMTHGDKLTKDKITLGDYLKTVPNTFKTFLENCNNRVLVFNNDLNEEQSYEQVSGLLTMIEALKMANDLEFYSDALFKKAEERVQVRKLEIQAKLQQEFKEKQEMYERSQRIQIQKAMRVEKEREIAKLKRDYEKRIENVRDEVREEISKEGSYCRLM